VMRESVITAMSLLRSMLYNPAKSAATSRELPPADDTTDVGLVTPYAAADIHRPGESSHRDLWRHSSAKDWTPQTLSSSQLLSSSAAGNSSSTSTSSSPTGDEGATQDSTLAVTPGSSEVLRRLMAQSDVSQDAFANDDVHVHFPAGGVPKDGPSAGVTTVLALASLLLGRPVRSDMAVTGEISLRGHVLPVGGIRYKVLAAHRAGIQHVLLPFGNMRHVKDEIPASSIGDIKLHFIKHIDEALAWAFPSDTEPRQTVLHTGGLSKL